MTVGSRIPLQTRKTYWGGMDYVRASTGLALKQIHMNAGSTSSLEFHVRKHEIYWVWDGELRLELRDGQQRGLDTHVILKGGDCYEIPPGVMHRRYAITDVCIVEACSEDRDEDTFIVEDGKKRHETVSGQREPEQHIGMCDGGYH